MTDEPRTRVAVVGTGPWWGREHARVYSERADVDLCAVVGRNHERTERRAREFGANPYVDIDEMLERERPDLVSLCLPNEGHFEPTLKVIRAGFPLFVEKPLVFDLDEADVLLREAEARSLFFAINFNHRYATPVAMAADTVRAGALGELIFATWRFGGEPGTSAHPHANLIETQCHGLDMLEHLCGPIDSVTAQMTDRTGRGWSTLVAALHFANGAVGSLVGSYDASYAYPGTHQLELNGTGGRVLVEDTVRRYTFTRAGSEVSSVWQAGYFNDDDRQFHRTFDKHVDAMLQALRGRQPPPVHARAGHRALVLALAIIASFETGTRVDVPILPVREGA
ncbi:MAG TPA: Gfo/Idh/MocA family oxidoreductase [Actinomycetes bacterium]|nr:Gfo/Idh/MocA family oxidoreductase [Actinomycetes bacterium]